MSRVLFRSAFWGAALAIGGYAVFGYFSDISRATNLVKLQAEPPRSWVNITRSRIVVPEGKDPEIELEYEILRRVGMRITSSPRNIETGEVVCAGRTITFVLDPEARKDTTPLSALAGLKDCDWPAGVYKASITWSLTDAATNIDLKPIVMESNEFRVGNLPP